MQVSIELPDDVVHELQDKWKDLSHHLLEATAAEGYRSGALTEWQVQRLLRFQTRLEVHRFLREHGAFLEYSPEEIEREIETSRQLVEQKKREISTR
jgi:hypothetical protein